MASIDLSGLIPTTFVPQIIRHARTQSAVLTLGRRIPIPTGRSSVPVPGAFPKAAFVTAPGGRKPFTDLKIGPQELVAEEVAAVIAIPDSYLEDSSINLWQYAQPLLGDAIGLAVDNAALFGIGAPASYPPGGIIATALQAPSGVDVLDTVNLAMGLVEDEGLPVTGHAAALATKQYFRGVRDNSGALLLGRDQIDNEWFDTLYGVRVNWNTYLSADVNFITGDWDCLMVGVRQDIRYRFSNEGVLVGDDDKVAISAFQDNQTLLKVWARVAVGVLRPVTPATDPDGAEPFAKALLGPSTLTPGGGASGASATTATAAKKATA